MIKKILSLGIVLMTLNYLIGQEKDTIQVFNLEAVQIQAKSNDQRLNNVDGLRILESKKTSLISISNLTANFSTNNPRQIYASVPGINVWESDALGIQLGIGGRGLSPNRTSHFNTRQNGYDISADPLGYPESYYTPLADQLEKIELIRGAASLQYGTQFGGMINFEMKKPYSTTEKPLHFMTRNTIGSWQLFSTYNEISWKLSHKVDMITSYNHKVSSGWRPNSQISYHNMFTLWRIKVSENVKVQAEFLKMYYLAQQPGGLTDALFESDPRQSIRSRNWFEVDWNLANMKLDWRINDKIKLNSTTFGLIASRKSLGVLSPINVVDFNTSRDLIDGYFKNIGNETRLLIRYHLGMMNNNALVVGSRIYSGTTLARQGDAADGRGSGANFGFTDPDNVEKSQYNFINSNVSIFAENIFRISDKWSVTPGARFEYIATAGDGYYTNRIFDFAGNLISSTQNSENLPNNIRSFVIMGIGTTYKFKYQELYANVTQNYRAINFTDLRIDNPNSRVDQNIKDEDGFNVDVGIRSQKGQRWYYDASLFLLKYNGRIGFVLKSDTILFNDFRFRTNVGDALITGVESFTNYSVLKDHSAWKFDVFLNTTFLDARYIKSQDRSVTGRDVEFSPGFILRSGFHLGYKKFRLSTIFSYTSSQFTDATNAVRTATAVNGLIPAYSVWDMSLQYSLAFAEFHLSINNVLNTAYFTRRADAYPGPGIIPADGRSFAFSVTFRL